MNDGIYQPGERKIYRGNKEKFKVEIVLNRSDETHIYYHLMILSIFKINGSLQKPLPGDIFECGLPRDLQGSRNLWRLTEK